MNVFLFLKGELRQSKGVFFGLTVLLALALAVAVSVIQTERMVKSSTIRAADQFDILVGTKGSRSALLLGTVYLRDEMLSLVPMPVLNDLSPKSSDISWAAPLAFGDRWRDCPIAGTSSELVNLGGKRPLASGRMFLNTDEAVVGAGVPLKEGDSFAPSHGSVAEAALDEDGKLLPQAVEVLEVAAQYKLVVGTGHLSAREGLALVREARRLDGLQMVLTHADNPADQYTLEQQQEAQPQNNDTTVNEDPPIDYNTPDISQGADSYIVSLSLDVSKAKVDYYLNEEFNKDNLVVTANYSDETTKDVTSLVTIDFSDFDSSKEGVYTIDVIYDDEKQQLYSSYEVVVSNLVDLITTPYIVGLTLDVNSVKTKYIYGEELEDFSNLKATIYYSDSTTKDVTIEDNKLSVDSSNLNLKQAGFYDLIVNYKDNYQASNGLSQDITVSNFYTVQVFDELTKLEFVSGNLEVLQYQNLDYSDWQVKATYYSENTAIICYCIIYRIRRN